jgi:hypothetical protein
MALIAGKRADQGRRPHVGNPRDPECPRAATAHVRPDSQSLPLT